ncbi:hypothetical protein [Polluticoccus soli]|uniref:hypothetical protein n=1 Tax=Polluticoccus soli TaxID=3034150 RepID=UPI0023E271CC|nr:hypothetical protein [Flavipsychrobacter sp. JY13-12]
MFFSSEICRAQEPEYEEILVSVNIQGMGTIEVPALIDNKILYLPITDIFDYLKIKNEPSQNFDSVTGFFISQENTYIIDHVNQKIFFKGVETKLANNDLLKTETGLYLKSPYFGTVFELPSVFNYRALLVNMSSKNELPVMRDTRLEAIRGNLRKLKGEIVADTVLRRLNPWIHFGMTDWSVIGAQQSDGMRDTRVNLGLGGIALGGEVNASLNYSTSLPFKEKQQFYWWRYVNNDAKTVKQVALGKVPVATVASIYSPVLGVHVTNIPTIAKRSFGSYRLSNITEPGWIVELYVNNILVDYVKADEAGFFTFDVPLVYGNSAVKLRYYGPFGEERSKEENISIPFNFMTPGKFEYAATAGVVEDDSLSRLARGGITYGLNRFITISTGVEYLSSVTTSPVMPYAATAIRLACGLLMFGEYNYQVRAKGGIFYRTVNNWQFEGTYTNYTKGQKAINNNAEEEMRAVASVPFRMRKLVLFTMFTFNQTKLSSTNYTTTEWLLSGSYKRFDARFNTIGVFVKETQPNIYTNFALACRLPHGFVFTPEAQYQYTINEFLSIKGLLEKRVLKRGYVGLSYEENFKTHFRNFGLQMRYDFDFAQVGFTGRYLNNKFSFLEAARGGVMYDQQTSYAGLNSSTSIGRAGIVLLPYLDINCNNTHDENEPRVSGLKFRINAGRVQPEGRDTTIRITSLEPYNNYLVELNRLSFDNIAWQMRKTTLKVFAEPNMFRLIEIPISVVGEVTGNVNLIKGGIEQGQGQILVCIYKNDSLISKVLSEPDGYFSYIGLAPGEYVARIDSTQLRKINMISSGPRPFTIATTRDGDVVEGLQFTLRSIFDTIQREQTSNTIIDTVPTKVAKAPKTIKKIPTSIKKPVTTTAFKPKNYASYPSPMMAAKRPTVPEKIAVKQPESSKSKESAKTFKPVAARQKKETTIRQDSTKTVESIQDRTDTVTRSQNRISQSQNSMQIMPIHTQFDDSMHTTVRSVVTDSFKTATLLPPDSNAAIDSLEVTEARQKTEGTFIKKLRRLFGTNREE